MGGSVCERTDKNMEIPRKTAPEFTNSVHWRLRQNNLLSLKGMKRKIYVCLRKCSTLFKEAMSCNVRWNILALTRSLISGQNKKRADADLDDFPRYTEDEVRELTLGV